METTRRTDDMRRLTLLFAGLLALALTAGGCGERKENLGPSADQRLELMLDWVPNPDHAGIYAAQGSGYFADAGVDLTIRTPADPSAPIKQVAAGRVDLAISYEPEVLRARDQGQKVVSVAAIVPQPLTSVVSLPPHDVPNASALRGKTVGTAGIDYQDAFLDAMLRRANIDPADVKRRNVGFDLQKALLTGRVDATLGGFVNVEVVDLQLQKKNPTHFTVDEAGIPPYNELVLVTSEETLRQKRDAIRSFLGALSRGTRLAVRDPEAAAGFLIKANRELDPKLMREGTAKTPFEGPNGRSFGYQDPAEWQRFADFMHTAKVLQNPPDARAAFTNDLLPGQGLD
jgi:putative hydroxymethylpyrimidine transport system substrate-binding protein